LRVKDGQEMSEMAKRTAKQADCQKYSTVHVRSNACVLVQHDGNGNLAADPTASCSDLLADDLCSVLT